MRRYLIVLALAVVMVMASAGAALAGEVKGPPGQADNVNVTGALDHANSACAASGLNDYDSTPDSGQNASQVQTAQDSWLYYGFDKGDVGTLGLCKGGTGHSAH
jgi:hypothetical protein